MTQDDADSDIPPKKSGITEEDMEQIAAFLEQSRYERSLDDLRPSSVE